MLLVWYWLERVKSSSRYGTETRVSMIHSAQKVTGRKLWLGESWSGLGYASKRGLIKRRIFKATKKLSTFDPQVP